MRISIIFIVFLIVVTEMSYAQTNYDININEIRHDPFARFYNFSNYSDFHNGRITDIIQDSYGYIWLASTNGLSRFDGNTFHTYTASASPNSLTANLTTGLDIDSKGNLLISTEKGLCKYNYGQDDFTSIIGNPMANDLSDTFNVRALLSDGDSLLWIETLNGQLWKLNQQTYKVIRTYKHEKTAQPYYLYHSIHRDSRGVLWIGGRNVDPMYLDVIADTIAYVRFNRLEKPEKLSVDIIFYFSDSKGRLWGGALDGLFIIDPKNNYFYKIYDVRCYTMIEDHQANIWLGTTKGIVKLDLSTGKSINYLSNEDDQGSLPSNIIYKLFEDKTGNIWAATKNGLSVHIPKVNGIDYFFRIPGEKNAPSSSKITDIAESKEGDIWISSIDKGIDLFNPITYKFKHFNTQNVVGLPSNKVSCLLPMENGDLYCGLWDGVGFGKLLPKQLRFLNKRFNKTSRTQDWYNDLIVKDKNHLYIGFWGANGLTVFNSEKGIFEESLMDLFPIVEKSRLITKLHQDGKNRIWMGTTESGIFVYYPEADSSYSYLSSYNSKGGFTEEIVFDILEDENGNIWVSSKGLFKYDELNNRFDKIELGNKYQELEIYNMLNNKESNFWFLTNQGVKLFNIESNSISDYNSLIQINFTDRESAAYRLSDGRILFGGGNGLAIFNQNEIEVEQKLAEIYPSCLYIFDEVRNRNLVMQEEVILEYNENFFSIKIGSGYWGQNDPYFYYYKLDGFNKDWVLLSDSDKTARFTNVPPGNYHLHLKVVDNFGNQAQNNTSLKIIIKIPFYKTWWFLILIIVLGFSLILFIWSIRMKSVRLVMHNLELNQKLLRLQMNPHFIFNSLFAIQSYIYSHQTDLAGSYLSDFAKLVRLILENSRKEYISLEKEIESIKLYLKLQNLRFEKRFSYTIHIDDKIEPSEFFIPPMLAQPFIENAIEHGFMMIKYKGEIHIHYKLQKDTLNFEVRDNGIGITAAKESQKGRFKKHDSLAIDICKSRLAVLKKKRKLDIDFSLHETIDNNGKVTGTRVLFSIPFQTKLFH